VLVVGGRLTVHRFPLCPCRRMPHDDVRQNRVSYSFLHADRGCSCLCLCVWLCAVGVCSCPVSCRTIWLLGHRRSYMCVCVCVCTLRVRVCESWRCGRRVICSMWCFAPVLDVFPCLKLLSGMLKRLHDQFEQAAGRGVTVFRIS